MDLKKSVHEVQNKILEIMKYIDKVCRENDITYFIMAVPPLVRFVMVASFLGMMTWTSL